MSLNPRLLWADSLKGWLMLLVILGHAIQTVMPETCYQNQGFREVNRGTKDYLY